MPGNDDYAAMEEVLTRRLTAYLAERDRPPLERGEKPGKFAYPPQLLVVDGGKGQLGVAERVVRELGLEHEIPVAGLAKRFEEVFVPGPVRSRSRSRGGARRCSCCSGSATRPTASPTRSTASAAASG